MTGFGSPEIEAEAYRLGAYHYFRKPVEIKELLQRVATLGIPVRQ
jgi:DNA-binding response OmpR family regulator